jgi:hypothetical protein
MGLDRAAQRAETAIHALPVHCGNCGFEGRRYDAHPRQGWCADCATPVPLREDADCFLCLGEATVSPLCPACKGAPLLNGTGPEGGLLNGR